MELWADLHLHTNCSDGLLSPSELVEKADEAGLSAIAVCDHDTISGLDEAVNAADARGIEVVPGVELSTQYMGRDLHILGYMFDTTDSYLAKYLGKFREERYRRAAKMVVNLNHHGIHIGMSDVEGKARGTSIGRPHIAEVLMEKGYVETFQEAFHRYIGYGASSYVEKYKIDPEHAIQLIADARGISVLAHPGPVISEEMIFDLIKFGINGLEVIHPNLTAGRTQYLMEIAQTHHLLITGGSDCHGGRNGDLCIGKYNVPVSVIEAMKERKACFDLA